MAEPAPDWTPCLERIRHGDDDAARELVEGLYPLVIKIVRSHRAQRTDEEDLSQMVFAKIFAHLDQYAGQVPLEHWVSRIAVNTCINQIRQERCRPELRIADLNEDELHVVESITSVSREPDPAQQAASRDLASKLLETLAPKDRLVITLLDLEERSLEDIRQLTGWNLSMIKVRAFRARHKLRKHFARLSKEHRP